MAAEPEGEGREAEVLDRRVGEEPLEVALGDDERQRHGEAEQPEDDEQGRRERRAQRADRDEVEPGQRVERDGQRRPRQQRRDRARRLAVGVGQPGVERREPGLRAVAGEREDEGEADERRVEARRDLRRARVQASASLVSPSTPTDDA